MWCYTRVLAHYPYVVLAAVSVVSVTCLIVTAIIGDVPSFEEPLAGFEPRGTEISDRLTAYNNLLTDRDVSQVPNDHAAVIQDTDHLVYHEEVENVSGEFVHQKRSKTSRKRQFFCDVPDVQWAKVVYHTTNGEDLFTVTNIQKMCQLEDMYIITNSMYRKHCVKIPDLQKCCRPVSLGNYIALLANKESCFNITMEDVQWVRQLLEECIGFYHNFTITDSCDQRHSPFYEKEKCKGVPKKCVQYNAVYNIIHFA